VWHANNAIRRFCACNLFPESHMYVSADHSLAASSSFINYSFTHQSVIANTT
jgi:hypothetical protein